ncbi:MAG: DUF4838 domain-containing protein [Clostridia bacterium]|nr:DUF4838 domain-containing protein [Clostridia bacterium]
MQTKLIIHPDEMSKQWVDVAKKNNIDVIGIHSVGNVNAHINLKNDLDLFQTKQYKSAVDYANLSGIKVEYEIHAVSYLLPRELFLTHPEYFRADENGVRMQNLNFCASNAEALEIIANNAVTLAEKLYGSTNNYFFWTDDIKNSYCKCEKCKNFSPSDQNLILMNAIIKKMREKDKNAKIAFLAYYDTVNLPKKVTPEKGVFLEYAPYERDLYAPASAVGEKEVELIKKLIEFFGKENSCVLEYWYDNSYFSGYKKPPKKLVVNNSIIKEDVQFYLNLGFENVSSFACFLGQDYRELYGEPDFSALKK